MRNRVLIPTALLVALLGCAGGSNADPGQQPTIAGAKSMELTEPWKSMNLPIEGAVVEYSRSDGLLARYPSIPVDATVATYAAVKEALLAAGWAPDFEQKLSTVPPTMTSIWKHPDGRQISVDLQVQDERPALNIALL